MELNPQKDRETPKKERSTSIQITLIIADNGVGLPAGFVPAQSKSLGLHLIQTLTLQLEGTLEIISRPDPLNSAAPQGLTLCIRFPWVEPMR